ncbi:hypothetical protein ACCT11_36285, partial [Rhizobium johnstonii]
GGTGGEGGGLLRLLRLGRRSRLFGKVTVVYVWDILDSGGGRQHRIQGQESVPTAAADPWAGVTATVMQHIASKNNAEFSS